MVLFWLYDIVSCFLSLSYLRLWFFPFIALAFLGTVPCIIRSFISWR